jgi:class 3 adenylate cyclase
VSQATDSSLAEAAQAALARHDWHVAYDLLAEADRATRLGPDELELLADATWWVGRLPEAIEVKERAYAGFVKAGRTVEAARCAIGLSQYSLSRNAVAEGAGWLARAERLLEGRPEGVIDGWLAAGRAFEASLAGEAERSLAASRRAHEIALRFGDRDLEVLALAEQGALLVATGEVAEGLRLADEATVAAVSGELEPSVAGGVCCATIETCRAIGDWRRAAEWTEAQDRWCAREGISGFPGMCRLFRAAVKRHRGAWLEAEAEARRATDELVGYLPAAVGEAFHQIGQIRLRRGDLPAARDALLSAHSYLRDPEPTLSLLLLAEGKPEAASASIRRALDEPSTLPSWAAPTDTALYRASLLPAGVEIALAVGDEALARTAADELAEVAKRYDAVAVRASAAWARGAVELAAGDEQAAATLREAIRLWTEVDDPYERARSQALLSRAYARAGDEERAELEARAARTTFERLGALRDQADADVIIASIRGDGGPTLGAPETAITRAFMFTDIVDSTSLAELLGDEAWETLVRWHDRALRALVAEFGGEEVKATGDGFFLAFAEPDRAIECAIAIQRRLAEQRRLEGFALSVRIGIHQARARRTGLDYRGTGVNQAARIGGRAAAGEILVSAETIAGARREFAELRRESVQLKGLQRPVDVVAIEWR